MLRFPEDLSKHPQAFELNDVSKYFHHPSPIDPVAVASTWMDEGTRLVFATTSMTTLINTIKQTLPMDVINGLGAGWNFYDGIAGNISAIQQFRKLPDVQRRKKEKAAWAVQDLLLSEILIAGTTLTLLSQYGVLTGLAAVACTPLSAITFAVGTWGALIHSLVNLKREYSKLNDEEYLFQDKITKYNNVATKLEKLNTQISEENADYQKIEDEIQKQINKLQEKIQSKANKNQIQSNITSLEKKLELMKAEHLEKLQRINAQMDRWQKIQSRLGAQLQALKQIKFAQGLPPALDEVFKKIDLEPANADDYELNAKITAQLKKNQKEKILKQSIATFAWATAAVGMTLVAVSPFAGPFAPILLTVGVAITAVAGAIKLVEALGSRITNALARKHRYSIEQRELLSKYKEKLASDVFKNPIFDNLSELEKLKYYLSYEYSLKHNSGILQESWYESLNSPSVTAKQRKAILDNALEKKIKEQVLKQTFQLNDHNPEESMSQLEKIKEQISDKQLDSIVNRECRASLKEYLKEGLVSMFSHKNEHLATVPEIDPEQHPRDSESI